MGWRTSRERIAANPAIARIVFVGRRIRRGRQRRSKRDLLPMRPLAEPVAASVPAPDPVRIAVLAIDSLAPASMRAAFSGTEVCVTVPDAATAVIFQAAIAQTSRTRSTDRLIRIVVD